MGLAMGLWVVLEAVGGQIPGEYSPYQVVWARYGIHIVLLALLLGRRWRRMVKTRRPGFQTLRSLLMVGMPAFFITGLRFGAPRDIWAGFWVAPLIVVGLSSLLLGEGARLHLWLATGAGLVGALLIAPPSSLPVDARALFPLGMAACFALYAVLTRRLQGESVESRLFYTALGPFVCLSPIMLYLGKLPTPRALLFMTLVGAVGLLVLWALDMALDLAPASLGAPLMYTQLLWGLALGGLLGEVPGTGAMVGVLIVVATVVYVVHLARRLDASG